MAKGRAKRSPAAGEAPRLDLDRYVPALLTFVANKLSRSANTTYQRRFGVNVTEWRILSLLDGLALQTVAHRVEVDRDAVFAWSTAYAEQELGLPAGALT